MPLAEKTTRVDVEQQFWLSIKDSTRGEDWQMYLDEYPDGRLAPLARLGIERLEAKGKQALSLSLMAGTWESWQEGTSESSLNPDKNDGQIWEYSIPAIDSDETYNTACVSLTPDQSISLSDSVIHLTIQSRKGTPVRLNFYSFVPGYSQENDKEYEESAVPAGILLPMVAGQNEFQIDSGRLKLSSWWLAEHNNPDVHFFANDIRWLDFCTESDEPISDTLEIHALDIVRKQ